MKRIFETRQVVKNSLRYVSGAVCDLGTNGAKYKKMIKENASSYTFFNDTQDDRADYFGDPLQLPFSDVSFDTVLSCEFLEHIEKPWILIEEIGRILKVGGICILTTPFLFPRHNRGQDLDYYRFTREGLSTLFVQNGFVIIESGGYNRLFGTIYLMLRNEYSDKNSGRVKKLFFNLIGKLAVFLDGFNRNNNIYSNSYVIAKKI